MLHAAPPRVAGAERMHGLGGGCRRGRLSLGAMGLLDGLQLLRLVGGEDGVQLLAGGLLDVVHLLFEIGRCDGCVGLERGDPQIAVREDRFYLGALVWSEVELFRQPGGLAVWVGRVGRSGGGCRCCIRRGLRLLGTSKRRGQDESKGCGQG